MSLICFSTISLVLEHHYGCHIVKWKWKIHSSHLDNFITSCVCWLAFSLFYYYRNGTLQAKLARYSVYEKFLMKVLDQLPEGKCKLIKTVLTVLLHDYIYIFIINLNVMMMIKSVITCMPKSLEISVKRQLNIGLFLFSLTRIFRYWSTLIGRTSHHNLWKTSSFLK